MAKDDVKKGKEAAGENEGKGGKEGNEPAVKVKGGLLDPLVSYKQKDACLKCRYSQIYMKDENGGDRRVAIHDPNTCTKRMPGKNDNKDKSKCVLLKKIAEGKINP